MSGMYFLKAEQNDNACHSVICRLSLCDRTLTVILEAFQVHKYITFLDWTGLVQSLPVRPGLDWIRIAAFGSGLVWTPSNQSISYSGFALPCCAVPGSIRYQSLLPDSEVSLKSRGFISRFQGQCGRQRAEGFLEVYEIAYFVIL